MATIPVSYVSNALEFTTASQHFKEAVSLAIAKSIAPVIIRSNPGQLQILEQKFVQVLVNARAYDSSLNAPTSQMAETLKARR